MGLNAIRSNDADGPRFAAAPAGVLDVVVEFGLGVGGVSYRIVECSRLRRSNARRLPSAPTETNESVDPGAQATSYTSRSCAMSCVTALLEDMSHTVHVVSIEEVTTSAGLIAFQEKLVSGAVVGFGFLDCT